MKTLAVIPARGGSKGIIGKNLARIKGRTLVEWSVECAAAAGFQPVVSSDSHEILDTVGDRAIRVLRPKEISTDKSYTQDAVLDALMQLGRVKDEVVLMMQCTTPFLSPASLTSTYEALGSGNWSYAASPFKDFVVNVNGVTISPPKWDRRQDMESRYIITGGAYCYRVESLLKWKQLYYEHSSIVVIDRYEGWNIDDPADLILAECIAERGLAGTWLKSI